ncbi:inositol-pentakisphosphate 2-kinase [Patella vulgata]|uniref:inositol-pentakisphosphate 2-kinase n=1 Tax=Patella vulgata TaxID=6465 RepID=UPI0024A96056|nr:inositol-pentakisphosphate 2-kinase [Patella vulgata]
MALPIERKTEWQYRGEGNCSLAVANLEEQQVYRFVKQYYTQQLDAITKSLDTQQTNLPTDIIEDELRKVINYVENVMQPLLSTHYVEPPVLCEIKNGLTKEAEVMVNESRPVHRRCKSQDNVDTRARTALVLPDLCFLPNTGPVYTCTQSLSNGTTIIDDTACGPTISIELKPKKGFLPQSQYIDKASLRHQVCKYCMHQRLKAREGQWPRPTNYCPLDLFSGNRQRMKHALLGLIHTPQNNLKICKNGVEVYGAHKQKDLNLLLKDFFTGDARNKYLSSFLDLVIEILLSPRSKGGNSIETLSFNSQVCYNSKYVPKSHSKGDSWKLPIECVLEKIYSVQSLDELDIDGIYPIYQHLQTHLNSYPQHRSNWGLDGPYSEDWLTRSTFTDNSEHLQSAVLKVKKFLISKTVQDCSIMVALQPLVKRPSDMSSVINFDEQYFRYSISIIDLDPKRFDKIPTYYIMEQEMEKAYQENMDKVKLRDIGKKCETL